MLFTSPLRRVALVGVLCVASNGLASGNEPGLLTFNRDIRPILSKNCFACHGPDAAARKAGLRMDDRDSAVAAEAIVPGDVEASALIERIFTEDPDDVMPPPESNLSLTAAQKETLRQWITEGAAYERHWAFIPPQKPAVSQGAELAPIDALVRAQLEGSAIAPAPEAGRETLIRRVAFDLTGLPPTLEEIDTFLGDGAPDAYERMVDRYLARPAYGEHMAGLWLDVARYADTYGYQNDRNSTVWPWRDWVIQAFNDNMPYNQFIKEQLAGDLLPDATQDQRLATAFNRLHRQTNEGGSVLEEFRVAYVADRTETFGTAFLGMTLNCAKCHDHKFDPISQENFYALSAFFSNIDESGMYSHFTNAIPSPSMFLYKDGERAKHAALRDAIAGEEKKLLDLGGGQTAFSDWKKNPDRVVAPLEPVVDLALDSVEESKTPYQAGEERFATLTRGPKPVSGAKGQALLFDGDDGVQLKDAVTNFDRYQPASYSIWLRMAATAPRSVIFHRSKAAEDAANRGYEFLLTEGKPEFALCHFWPGNAIRVRAKEALPENVWTHCAVTYDGSSRADGVTIYVDGRSVETEVVRDGLTKTILYEGEADTPVQLAMRFRDKGFKNGRLDSFKIFDRRLSALEVAAVAGQANLVAAVDRAIAKGDDSLVEALFANTVDEGYRTQLAALETARKAEADFVGGLQSVMTMEEMAEFRTAHVLERGEYNHRKKPVAPGTPESILPMSDDLPRNRLGLAQWLTDPRNPLTARVAVNRFWQHCFGRGIVKTQEDFGSQSGLPSNQPLLDYLATRFVETGWDVKSLLREIVCSATYRQDSTASPELFERDPDNALLARGPKYRMRAEEIRDNALASAGLLVDTVGGPSVKPYQPDGLWKEASGNAYTPDTGEGLYRRSLYTYIKRTVPPPSMLNFNATSREVCLVRRERTVTPLQALVLLNDPQYVEAARVLAADALGYGPEDGPPAVKKGLDFEGDEITLDTWVTEVFRRLTSRRPDAEELRILRDAYEKQYAVLGCDPEAALAYLKTGEAPLPEGVGVAEFAAATAVTQAIMNHEEFQVKQ